VAADADDVPELGGRVADGEGLAGVAEDIDGAGFRAGEGGFAALGGERTDDDVGDGVVHHQPAQERVTVHAGRLDVEGDDIGADE